MASPKRSATPPPKRRYQSEVRVAQSEATRAAIVDAAYRLLRTTRPVDLSYADVAAAAGVSTRTVYRCFARPEDLFMAVSEKLLEPEFGRPIQVPETSAQLFEAIEGMFRQLAADPALFRVVFAVPTRSRLDQPTLFARLFGEQVAQLTDLDRRSAFALIDLMISPYAWDVMHHNWSLPTERSMRAILVAIRALFDYLEREPAALSPRNPAPTLSPPRRRR